MAAYVMDVLITHLFLGTIRSLERSYAITAVVLIRNLAIMQSAL